ncbi:MAG: hypothetical protein SP1CHLAM54_00940 [Chlamydiia bacterium]|nr:hypothetical protein [Chlamydiia bacterium]MCH9615016.1 hypothetical protein [Chlamydiia bacterium]MCH9629933.1 hypothetical protein [Chlamydiia bacterium]
MAIPGIKLNVHFCPRTDAADTSRFTKTSTYEIVVGGDTSVEKAVSNLLNSGRAYYFVSAPRDAVQYDLYVLNHILGYCTMGAHQEIPSTDRVDSLAVGLLGHRSVCVKYTV